MVALEIKIADLPTRLENCAAWNLAEAEKCERLAERGATSDGRDRRQELQRSADRLHRQAFRLFVQAKRERDQLLREAA